ncbi:hypothetical protein ADK34_37030, partial [Streptomyces viridochromogenes]
MGVRASRRPHPDRPAPRGRPHGLGRLRKPRPDHRAPGRHPRRLRRPGTDDPTTGRRRPDGRPH